jgi:hypothetical protein
VVEQATGVGVGRRLAATRKADEAIKHPAAGFSVAADEIQLVV